MDKIDPAPFFFLPLQSKQTPKKMDTQVTNFRKFTDLNVEFHTNRPEVSGRIMSGRALFTQQEDRVTFVEAPPRANRSKLILASNHASLRRRHNGKYSINIVFGHNEKWVKEQLLAEVRGLASAASKDAEEEAKAQAEALRKIREEKEATHE